jgi:hypothetical protein
MIFLDNHIAADLLSIILEYNYDITMSTQRMKSCLDIVLYWFDLINKQALNIARKMSWSETDGHNHVARLKIKCQGSGMERGERAIQTEPVPETLPRRPSPRDTFKVDGILTSDTRLAARVLFHSSASSSGSSCGVLDLSRDAPASGVAVPSNV